MSKTRAAGVLENGTDYVGISMIDRQTGLLRAAIATLRLDDDFERSTTLQSAVFVLDAAIELADDMRERFEDAGAARARLRVVFGTPCVFSPEEHDGAEHRRNGE